MPNWREFEIKDFLGEASSNRNPRKNECQICKNFDIREITGDLTSREGYRLKYAKPSYTASPQTSKAIDLSSVTELRTENFIIDIDGTETEVTLQFMKGTLTAVSGSSASPASINIGLFFITPWYDGSAWQTGTPPAANWLWLNECYLTTISNLSNNSFDIYGDFSADADFFKQWCIYNIDDDDYAEIYDSAYGSATATTVKIASDPTAVKHNFANGDNVLVMRNFIPYADLKEYYNVTAKQVSFHNVLNDLRIGFGGLANRLPLMIGHRDKSFAMDTSGLLGADISDIAVFSKIMLTPYNSITEDANAASLPAWGDEDVFHILRVSPSASNALPAGRWFLKLTGLIDGYEEFVLPAKIKVALGGDQDTVGTSADYIDTTNTKLAFMFRVNWALFNKRITKIRLYMSHDSQTSADEAYNPYFRIAEWNIIGTPAGSARFDLSDYGYLYNTTVANISGTNWQNALKTGTQLDQKLNYPITDDYARGWDHAVAVDRRIFIINPYVAGERVPEAIYFSPFSGAGASLYDAFQGGSYINVDSNDANNLRALGKISNVNLAAFKTNNMQKVRANTAQLIDTAFGFGVDTHRSIVNHGDRLTWCSQKDVFSTRGVGEENLTKGKIRNLFRAIPDKTVIFATKEENDNAYRFYDGAGKQYLLAERGWVQIDTYLDPEDYMISKDGTVWFMKDGDIYYQTGNKDVNSSDAGQDIGLQWKSIPFDIALLGEGITSADMIYVDSVWARYYTAIDDLTMKIYIDGVQFGSDITLDSSLGFVSRPLPMGGIGRRVEIEITCDTKFEVITSSLGFRWRPMPIGSRV